MKPRLLIAYSDDLLLDAYQSYFWGQGYEVEVAANVAECLATLPEFAPDILVLQRELRGVSADLILSRLRSGRLLDEIPQVLMLTDHGVNTDLADPIVPPVYTFLRAPATLSAMLEAVRGATTGHKSDDELSLYPLGIH